MGDSKPKPDISLEVGYDLKAQKAVFSIGLSNIFDKLGRKKLGFTFSRWFTRFRGQSDAKLALPAATDLKPVVGRERDIWTDRDTQAEKVSKHVDTAVKDTSAWIENHSPAQALSTDRIKKDILAKLDEVFAYFDRRFEMQRSELSESLYAYESFQKQHGLDRPARVPLFFLRPIVMLLAAMLLETLVNATLFAGISSQGLIGGWVIAVIISVVNIALGLVLGLIIVRYGIAWTDWRRQALVGVGIAMVVAIVFFNLYVAHFREIAEHAVLADRLGEAQLSREKTPGFGEAWPHFLANPFDLGSVLGVGLLVIGLVIAGFATYEGYQGFTDPFPGYGNLGKRFFLNLIYRQHIEDNARSMCYAVLDRARVLTDRSWGLHSHFKSQVFQAVNFLELLNKRAKAAEDRVNNHAWSLVTAYRGANRTERAKLSRKAQRDKSGRTIDPGPAPAYFTIDTRTSGDWKSSVPSIAECQRQANAANALIENNMSELERVREFIAELRLNAADVVSERMDPADLRLRAEVKEATTRRRDLKVISTTPVRA